MWSFFVKQVHAACDISAEGLDLASCLTLRDGKSVSEVYDTPAVLINLIVSNLFVLSGVFIFLMFIGAGLKFALQGSSKAKDEAKTLATSSGLGFIVMFCAYWIIQIIEIVTGTDILF